MYVADTNNHALRVVDTGTKEVTTFVGVMGTSGTTDATGTNAQFWSPHGLAISGTSLYVADQLNYAIRIVDTETKEVTTLAGSKGTPGTADGTGTNAQFWSPSGLAISGTSLYVADLVNHALRVVDTGTKVVTTVAGVKKNSGTADGTGTNARFYYPISLAISGTSLYVAGYYSHAIRVVDTETAVVTTLAGVKGTSGTADGTGTNAQFYSPYGLSISCNKLYVADQDNYAIRVVDTDTNEVTTVAGEKGTTGTADGTGTNARFSAPFVLQLDPAGDASTFYVADYNAVRLMNFPSPPTAAPTPAPTTAAPTPAPTTAAPTPAPTTAAPTPAPTPACTPTTDPTVTPFVGQVTSGTADATGTNAQFNSLNGLAISGTKMYVADTNNHALRVVDTGTKEVTTFVGVMGTSGTTDATGTNAQFWSPHGLAISGTSLYVADQLNYAIRIVDTETKEVTTLAGSKGTPGTADGTGTNAQFWSPSGLAISGTSLYVADLVNHALRVVDTGTKVVTTVAGVKKNSGTADGTGTNARFYYPISLAISGTSLYVAGYYSHAIRVVDTETAVVTTLAGVKGTSGTADGTGTNAQFYSPYGLSISCNKLYVADQDNYAIRVVDTDTNEVTTVAGVKGTQGTADGTGTNARFSAPFVLQLDPAGDASTFYVADYNAVRLMKFE